MVAFLLSGLFGAQKYLVRIIVTVKDAPDGIAFIRDSMDYCPSLPWLSAQACQRTYTAKKSG